jgi:hypothetical protein
MRHQGVEMVREAWGGIVFELTPEQPKFVLVALGLVKILSMKALLWGDQLCVRRLRAHAHAQGHPKHLVDYLAGPRAHPRSRLGSLDSPFIEILRDRGGHQRHDDVKTNTLPGDLALHPSETLGFQSCSAAGRSRRLPTSTPSPEPHRLGCDSGPILGANGLWRQFVPNGADRRTGRCRRGGACTRRGSCKTAQTSRRAQTREPGRGRSTARLGST